MVTLIPTFNDHMVQCIWQASTELAKLSLRGSDRLQMCVPEPVGLALYARNRRKNLLVDELSPAVS